MALTSFMRDFGLDLVEKTQRDTIQGNIVSTFQVYPILIQWPHIAQSDKF